MRERQNSARYALTGWTGALSKALTGSIGKESRQQAESSSSGRLAQWHRLNRWYWPWCTDEGNFFSPYQPVRKEDKASVQSHRPSLTPARNQAPVDPVLIHRCKGTMHWCNTPKSNPRPQPPTPSTPVNPVPLHRFKRWEGKSRFSARAKTARNPDPKSVDLVIKRTSNPTKICRHDHNYLVNMSTKGIDE